MVRLNLLDSFPAVKATSLLGFLAAETAMCTAAVGSIGVLCVAISIVFECVDAALCILWQE